MQRSQLKASPHAKGEHSEPLRYLLTQNAMHSTQGTLVVALHGREPGIVTPGQAVSPQDRQCPPQDRQCPLPRLQNLTKTLTPKHLEPRGHFAAHETTFLGVQSG